MNDGISAYKASKITGVPQSTLKDRRSDNIDISTFKSGPKPLLTSETEEKLADHAELMSNTGYGYSRKEFIGVASDICHSLGKLDSDKNLSERWLYAGFVKRQPHLACVKARKLNINRAKSVTEEVVHKYTYFDNLKDILTKYDLFDVPQLIFNIDETGFSPEHNPPKILTKKGKIPNAITSPKSTMVTCIRASNAIGNYVPPFFIFKGKRQNDDIKEGATPGCGFALSENGWSNSTLFQEYIQEHFLKYVQRPSDKHILILFD